MPQRMRGNGEPDGAFDVVEDVARDRFGKRPADSAGENQSVPAGPVADLFGEGIEDCSLFCTES